MGGDVRCAQQDQRQGVATGSVAAAAIGDDAFRSFDVGVAGPILGTNRTCQIYVLVRRFNDPELF